MEQNVKDNDNHNLYSEPLINFKLKQLRPVMFMVSLSENVLISLQSILFR